MTKRKKLTDQEWKEVFRLRCRSKQGLGLSKEERALTNQAYGEGRRALLRDGGRCLQRHRAIWFRG